MKKILVTFVFLIVLQVSNAQSLVIRFDGVYTAEIGNGYFQHLKFFSDGLALYFYTNQGSKEAYSHALNYNARQFKPSGFYTLEGESILIPIYNPTEKKLVLFKGKIIDKKNIEGLFLSHEPGNGIKNHSTKTFKFEKG